MLLDYKLPLLGSALLLWDTAAVVFPRQDVLVARRLEVRSVEEEAVSSHAVAAVVAGHTHLESEEEAVEEEAPGLVYTMYALRKDSCWNR
jgi:hypothetical protein